MNDKNELERVGTVGYTGRMTITHQTLLDEEGKPTAAVIPWDEFRVIRAELEEVEGAPLSPEWKAELDRRMQGIKDGTTKGIPHDEVMDNVRGRLAQLRKEAKQGA